MQTAEHNTLNTAQFHTLFNLEYCVFCYISHWTAFGLNESKCLADVFTRWSPASLCSVLMACLIIRHVQLLIHLLAGEINKLPSSVHINYARVGHVNQQGWAAWIAVYKY